MGAREAGRLNTGCLAWLVDPDAERVDCFARRPQPAPVGGWCDEHLCQVDDAEQPGRVLFLPAPKARSWLSARGQGGAETGSGRTTTVSATATISSTGKVAV
jgi:hypothetical protein